MKRFWQEVRVTEGARGFGVALDERPLNTPAKKPVEVPGRRLAEALAAEWAAQEGEVNLLGMPLTRAVNVTIDRVAAARAEVAAQVAAYGETDLLCYRAPHPPRLAERQEADWDPLLDWAAERLGARLSTGAGVMHVPQPAEAVERLAAQVHGLSPWALTPMHELVALSGSLVIGLAVRAGRIEPAEGWRVSRLDEQWNIEQWGEDAEAAAADAKRRESFLAAARLLAILAEDRTD
jgi:chaperone required for assembly of F1-ATPase